MTTSAGQLRLADEETAGDATSGRERVDPNSVEFKHHGSFSLGSSAGPRTAEVVDMERAIREGIPVHIYEFAQGLVDYGRLHSPSPRIVIESKNGQEYTFDGKSMPISFEEVAAIEFRNGGPGLAPEDLVIFHHGEEQETLGIHGRGTTVALTYLASQGIFAKVSSNHQGQAWEARTHLKQTPTGKTNILNAEGTWYQKQSNATAIRIENPGKDFCCMLGSLGKYFLYANPHYHGALIVPPEDVVQTPSIRVKGGEVSCIKQIAERDLGNVKDIYIDGLSINLRSSRCILPWAISGLSHESDEWQVRRSQSSTKIEGSGLGNVLAYAIRHLDDEEILTDLITFGANMKYDIRCMEFNYGDFPMTPSVAAIIRKIWKEKFNDVLIAESDYDMKLLERKSGGRKQARNLYSMAFAQYLKQAGIKTVRDEVQIFNSVEMPPLNTLRVPFIEDDDVWEKAIEKIARAAEVSFEVVTIDGKKKLKVTFPELIKTAEDFNGQDADGLGLLLRMIAIVAAQTKVDCQILGVEEKVVHDIVVNCTSDWRRRDTFRTSIYVSSCAPKNFPVAKKCEEDRTYIFLEGDQINLLRDPQLSDKLIAVFKKIAKEVGKKLRKIPRKKRNHTRDDYEGFYGDAYGSGFDFNHRHDHIEYRGIGQISLSRMFEYDQDDPSAAEDSEAIVAPGYYCNFVGTSFVFDGAGGTARWVCEQQFAPDNYIHREVLHRYSAKLVAKRINGVRPLSVREDEEIIAFTTVPRNAKVEFFREVNTGVYQVRGNNVESLTYYTAYTANVSKKTGSNEMEPTIDETENVLDEENLLPHWKEFIASVRAKNDLTNEQKVILSLLEWSKRFVYDDNLELHDQIKGKSREEIATKIVNTARGICNLSATGFALLLRVFGVPTRYASGYWQQSENYGGSHGWPRYWTGERWQSVESLLNVAYEGSSELRRMLMREKKRRQNPKNVRNLVIAMILATLTGSAVTAGVMKGVEYLGENSNTPTASFKTPNSQDGSDLSRRLKKIIDE